MKIEADANGDEVPVPIGYVGSKATGENEINTGYVIYEGEEVVDDTNVAEARKTRNQYVWVPVPDPSKIYGTDSNGKMWGKIYYFTENTGTGIDKVTGAQPYGWSEYGGTMYPGTSYREPAPALKNSSAIHDINSRLRQMGLGAKTTHEWIMQMENEFNKMIESVKKYGGFYIGRYETGDVARSKAVVRKGNGNIDAQNWYTMYKKCKELRGENQNIETGMIWGCQFDRTLMWLIESKNKTKAQICKDSSSWGNYINNSVTYVDANGVEKTTTVGAATKLPTGSVEIAKANNIYDLAGNVRDRTMAVFYDDIYRVSMGGSYIEDSTTRTASIHYGNPPSYVEYNIGCRAMLYIK